MEKEFNINDIKVGISINDSYGIRFTDLILSGKKVIETRSRRTLDAFIGEWVGLIQTGLGKAKLVGYILLGEPIRYSYKEGFKSMDDDYDKHFVPSNNTKFYKGGEKFGYPILDYVKIEPRVLIKYQPISEYVRLDGTVCKLGRYIARNITENYLNNCIDKCVRKCLNEYLDKDYGYADLPDDALNLHNKWYNYENEKEDMEIFLKNNDQSKNLYVRKRPDGEYWKF